MYQKQEQGVKKLVSKWSANSVHHPISKSENVYNHLVHNLRFSSHLIFRQKVLLSLIVPLQVMFHSSDLSYWICCMKRMQQIIIIRFFFYYLCVFLIFFWHKNILS